jgi:anaerobic ribonucleoside-triphosphate reductase
VDPNANVERKNIATMETEIFKEDAVGLNRLVMYRKLKELYGVDLAEEYLRQLEEHEIYRHDETALIGKPYCVSVTLYPFLLNGNRSIGGTSDAPKNLAAFNGAFVNLVFALASQYCGAVATPEWLGYLDYYIRKEYGDDYYLHAGSCVDLSARRRTIDKVITDCFEQTVYSLNQPAAARGNQSVFWNVAYFDHSYFNGMFENFVFPDGTPMRWESVSWLQKRFMRWLNHERTRKLLTFPVETVNLLDDGSAYTDPEWKDFVAEMWAAGHSFFVYRSDSVDS